MDWDQVKHFERDEFGHADGVEPDWDLVVRLDNARAMAGIPFVITSGVRSKEHNARVGGLPSSSHLTGHAVDLACESARHRSLMVDALLQSGLNRIGLGIDFIHVDNDRSKPHQVMWLYES